MYNFCLIFSFDNENKTHVLQILRRSIVLIFLGVVLSSKGRIIEELRLPGVLQRLGLAYFIVGTLECFTINASNNYLPGTYIYISKSMKTLAHIHTDFISWNFRYCTFPWPTLDVVAMECNSAISRRSHRSESLPSGARMSKGISRSWRIARQFHGEELHWRGRRIYRHVYNSWPFGYTSFVRLVCIKCKFCFCLVWSSARIICTRVVRSAVCIKRRQLSIPKVFWVLWAAPLLCNSAFKRPACFWLTRIHGISDLNIHPIFNIEWFWG